KPVTKEALIRVVDNWMLGADRSAFDLNQSDYSPAHFDEIEVLDVTMISRLEQLDKDGKNGLVRKLIEMYVTMTPKTIEEIKAAAKVPGPQLRKLAHTLKSSSANLGARRMSSLLQRI